MTELTILCPDDSHLHLRDGEVLVHTVAHAAEQFGRVLVMPNLKPPVRNTSDAEAYKQRILVALPKGKSLELLMSLYLTDSTTPQDIIEAKASGIVFACKLYPAGATTNSDSGVTSIDKIADVLGAMQDVGLPLLVHGEVTHPDTDVFDKEAQFIEDILKPLALAFPRLKIIMEHITTAEAVAFVSEAPANVAATITAHHLLYNRSDIFRNGINPHMYCLPILKGEPHRQALLSAATSGNPKFFLGTDSAPHAVATKENGCGCAGIYTCHAAIQLYAEAFESKGALDKLEAFSSRYGAEFYGLPVPTSRIILKKEPWTVPTSYAFGAAEVRPLRAGQSMQWKLSP